MAKRGGKERDRLHKLAIQMHKLMEDPQFLLAPKELQDRCLEAQSRVLVAGLAISGGIREAIGAGVAMLAVEGEGGEEEGSAAFAIRLPPELGAIIEAARAARKRLNEVSEDKETPAHSESKLRGYL